MLPQGAVADGPPATEVTLPRYAGVVPDGAGRAVAGFALAMVATWWAWRQVPDAALWASAAAFMATWLVAIAITAKYTHKYPYRYYSYLLASHAKAASLQTAAVLVIAALADSPTLARVLWPALGVFLLADFLLSVPRRPRPLLKPFDPAILKSREIAAQAEPSAAVSVSAAAAQDGTALHRRFAQVAEDLELTIVAHVRASVPGLGNDTRTLVLSDRNACHRHGGQGAADLVIVHGHVNDLRRINRFFLGCADRLRMGGHLVCQYASLEERSAVLQARFGPVFRLVYLADFAWHRIGPKIPVANKLYFALTQGRNRAISKAEVWGRLSFCGLKVIAEADTPAGRILTAARIAEPIANKKPSYYPIVGLTKVGLDGDLLQTHKVRSMYPFSEFLQKQIFDANGLVGTGKFKNDFRLTEYGKFLRRHWIDEVPQIYDWLRGDIKLVGMRATSPHFLSLYPREFIERYVQVKPGLIPPLFDEGTEGFDAIVAIEQRYLNAYLRAPFRTDARLLWDTFRAIVFRGVRSK